MKIRYLTLFSFLLWMAGCVSPSPELTYHLLYPEAISVGHGEIKDPSVYLVVGPVLIPSYLGRPQMVVRHGDGTLYFIQYHRWAEPLDESITRAVAENLSRLTGVEKVAFYPFDPPEGSRSMRIFLDVVRFDTDDKGDAVFDLRWGVKDGGDHSISMRHTSLTGRVVGEGPSARSRALSRLIAEFSQEVADLLASGASIESDLR